MKKHGKRYAGAGLFIAQRQERLYANLNTAISKGADRRLTNPSTSILLELNEARQALRSLLPNNADANGEGLIWTVASVSEVFRLKWAGWRAFKGGTRQANIMTDRNFWRLASGRREYCVGCEVWKRERKANHYAQRWQKRLGVQVQGHATT